MPTTQHTPQLTVYRDGLVNLNTLAAGSLAADSARLLPPSRSEPYWLLVSSPELPGDIRLRGRADRLRQFRFRAPELALALFAALPSEQQVLRMALEPIAALGWRLVAQKMGT